MIAFAYNDVDGGMSEWRLQPANVTELQLGLTYRASNRSRYLRSSVPSPGAYSVDGLTILYRDDYTPGGRIMFRSSFVNAAGQQPWGGQLHNPASWDFGWAGYGPLSKLLYVERNTYGELDPKTHAVKIKSAWEIMLRPKRLTTTQGFFPVFAEDNGLVYFIPLDKDNVIRRTNLLGNDEVVIHTFDGGLVRALAITHNRSVAKHELRTPGVELIASVFFPAEHKSRIYTGVDRGSRIRFYERFSVAHDYVMVAGTGAFGNGNRILFTQGNSVLLWDNRDHSTHTIRYWWTKDGRHHYHSPIPPYRFSQFGSGLAISPDVPMPKTRKRRRLKRPPSHSAYATQPG